MANWTSLVKTQMLCIALMLELLKSRKGRGREGYPNGKLDKYSEDTDARTWGSLVTRSADQSVTEGGGGVRGN